MRKLLVESYINSEIFTGIWREINYCNRCARDPNYWDLPPSQKPPFGNPWLRGAKKFSVAFRIVFRILFSRFSNCFSCQFFCCLFSGAVSFCRRAAPPRLGDWLNAGTAAAIRQLSRSFGADVSVASRHHRYEVLQHIAQQMLQLLASISCCEPFSGTTWILGACAMTTKFLDNKICTFKHLLSWRFPQKKSAFWTIFLSAPKAPPLKKRKIYFYCRLAVSEICNPGGLAENHFWGQTNRIRPPQKNRGK